MFRKCFHESKRICDEHTGPADLARKNLKRTRRPAKVGFTSFTCRHDALCLLNAEASRLCSNYATIRPLVRDNSSPQQLKRRGFYMVDSSYTVPSDPNTMRDAGPCRNAVYCLSDQAEQEFLRRSQQSFSKKTLAAFSQAPISVGDLERARQTQSSRCTHLRPHSTLNPQATQRSGFFSNMSGTSAYVVDRVEVVRTNDYTKNISSSIFSPALTHSAKLAKKASPMKAAHPQKTQRKEAKGAVVKQRLLLSPQKASIVSQKSSKSIHSEIMKEKEVSFARD